MRRGLTKYRDIAVGRDHGEGETHNPQNVFFTDCMEDGAAGALLFQFQCRFSSVGDVNLTTKDISNKKKQSKTKSDSNKVLAKFKELTRNKLLALNILKCKTYNGNYITKDCYYTLKNLPS